MATQLWHGNALIELGKGYITCRVPSAIPLMVSLQYYEPEELCLCLGPLAEVVNGRNLSLAKSPVSWSAALSVLSLPR